MMKTPILHIPAFVRIGALFVLLAASLAARTWTSSDGSRTFEGELKAYNPDTGALTVTRPDGRDLIFNQDKLSEDDIAFLKETGAVAPPAAAGSSRPSSSGGIKELPDELPDPDGKEALGQVIDAPVLILKSCVGNRALGWDLLPPSAVGTGKDGLSYQGDSESSNRKVNEEVRAKNGGWYAGLQYDQDIGAAQTVLKNLSDYYPGAKEYEVAGFFWWQGNAEPGKGNVGEGMGRLMVESLQSN